MSAYLEVGTGEVCYANAGHEPPLLARRDGTIDSLQPTGPILGAVEGARFENRRLFISPGDWLMLVTDGVTEARDATGEFLESAGAADLLIRAAGQPTTVKGVETVARDLARFTGGQQHDDIAIVILRRVP